MKSCTVRIIKSYDQSAWYTKLIGQTIEVYVPPNGYDDYIVKEDCDQHKMTWRHIEIEDTVKVEEET